MDGNLYSQLCGLWDNNHRLWEERINKELLIPLDKNGGITIDCEENTATLLAFGPASTTFRAVQQLCNPRAANSFWADGFVLTRGLFETFVTLEWIGLDRKIRAQLYGDEHILKMAHFLRMLTDKTVVSSEKQKEIEGWHRDVMARHHCDPTKQKLLPSIEKRVNEVAAQLSAECPHLQFHYEMYYRDVSGFAHSSAWGIMSRLPRSTSGPIEATADPSLGIQALMTNGEWFLRVLWAWNKVAKVLTEEQIQGWQKEWAEAHLGMGL